MESAYDAVVVGSGFGGGITACRFDEGLFVLDGSVVPTALEVNPSKTIAALCERGVEHLLEERSP